MFWFWIILLVFYLTICFLEIKVQKQPAPALSAMLVVTEADDIIEGVIRDIERLVRWRQGALELVVVDCSSCGHTSDILQRLKLQRLNFKLVLPWGSEHLKAGLKQCSGKNVMIIAVPQEVNDPRKVVHRVWRESNSVKEAKRAG